MTCSDSGPHASAELRTRDTMLPDLQIALNPQSIAIVGASENPNRIGGRPLAFLARFGFKGRVYPINPKRTETQGFRTYPTLAAVPEFDQV